ncbi:hypothetical protein VP1G_04542 [Cytospora mali]|uniref:R3H domain-containing protein n=1 Tax=Cytospora mali TaxID=578113 RepID=A0A194UZW2_CYTMA|nr:hypothetical protein VP1G_04542 [Valsa mali var. pyri (nom. inval.)]
MASYKPDPQMSPTLRPSPGLRVLSPVTNLVGANMTATFMLVIRHAILKTKKQLIALYPLMCAAHSLPSAGLPVLGPEPAAILKLSISATPMTWVVRNSETFLTCDCQRRKQKVKCLTTRVNPEGPQREALKCDDECLRQKRNRQLAEALNVDADHTDNHIPYQDLTLKLFRDHVEWAETQEREFRVFAESNLRNMRFKPMKGYQRQFLHVLAEDFGLDSESQDPDPHRHVSIFKGPRFVAAPKKTLMQCLRILRTAAPARATPAPAPAANKPAQQPYNALLLSQPKFGLTVEELDTAVAADCAAAIPPEHKNNVSFTTSFLPTDEVLIKTTTRTTIASIASGALTGAQLESLLTALKPKVAKAVSTRGLAGGVTLCAADASSSVVRREGDGSSGSGGWSMVASRAAARPRQWAAAPVLKAKVPGTGFVALRRLGAKKQENKQEPAVEEKKEEAAAVESKEEDVAEVDKDEEDE